MFLYHQNFITNTIVLSPICEVVVSLLKVILWKEAAIDFIFSVKSWMTFSMASTDTKVGLRLETVFFKLGDIANKRHVPLTLTVSLIWKIALIESGHVFLFMGSKNIFLSNFFFHFYWISYGRLIFSKFKALNAIPVIVSSTYEFHYSKPNLLITQ